MSARRYTVVIADRSSGVMRHLTINLRSTVLGCLAVFALPVLMGLGAKWSARAEMDQLRAANTALQVENGSYRAATGELTSQIQTLETVINDLGARSQLDPAQARAMQKLPAVVKARAAGGTSASNSAIAEIAAEEPVEAASSTEIVETAIETDGETAAETAAAPGAAARPAPQPRLLPPR